MAAPSSSFDGIYEYMYRSLGDGVVRWCGSLDMDALPTRHLLRQDLRERHVALDGF